MQFASLPWAILCSMEDGDYFNGVWDYGDSAFYLNVHPSRRCGSSAAALFRPSGTIPQRGKGKNYF